MAASRHRRCENFRPIPSTSRAVKASSFSALKILQIVQTLDPKVGGVAPAVSALSRGLARRGHKIDIVTLDEPGSLSPNDSGLTVHALGRGRTSYQYSKQFVEWLQEHGASYDRVIVNGLWQHQGFATWQQLGGSDTPYYDFLHGMLEPRF